MDTEHASAGLQGLLHWAMQTHAFRQGLGAVRLPIGYYANVIDIGHGMGLAISIDGVGSKLLVAQLMNKYDSVGIDCVAMNANDILCVEPGRCPWSIIWRFRRQRRTSWRSWLRGCMKGRSKRTSPSPAANWRRSPR
jgi:hypothetical protein